LYAQRQIQLNTIEGCAAADQEFICLKEETMGKKTSQRMRSVT
jgi:hypothetical protein